MQDPADADAARIPGTHRVIYNLEEEDADLIGKNLESKQMLSKNFLAVVSPKKKPLPICDVLEIPCKRKFITVS